jgi:hypothetical protein
VNGVVVLDTGMRGWVCKATPTLADLSLSFVSLSCKGQRRATRVGMYVYVDMYVYLCRCCGCCRCCRCCYVFVLYVQALYNEQSGSWIMQTIGKSGAYATSYTAPSWILRDKRLDHSRVVHT